MKKVWMFTFLITFLLLNACKKNSDYNDFEQVLPDVSHVVQASDFDNAAEELNWSSPSELQLNKIWANMMENIDYIDGLNYIYLNGVFNWKETRLVKQIDDNNYLISIPSMIEGKVVGILFASVENNKVNYFHVHLSLLQRPTNEVIEALGIKRALLAITIFAAHQQHFDNYISIALVEHLNNEAIRNAMASITPRGWCLIEVSIYTPPNTEATQSQTTGWVTNDGTNYHPTGDDVIDLQGTDTKGGYEVFQFWAWCPDEDDQNGWDTNWGKSGTEIGDGSTTSDLPDWNFYGNGWFQGNENCMFYFGGLAEAEFSNFEESLLEASCGEASAFAVHNTMANIINGLCNQTTGEFPTQIFSVEETMNEIENSLANNPFYEMGQLICEVCGTSQQCIDEFAPCAPGTYESCVRVKAFLITNSGINLSNEEVSYLENNISKLAEIEYFLANRTDLDPEAKEMAVELFLQLLVTDPEFEELAEDWSAFPSFLWPFIREVGVELAVELFQKLAQNYGPTGQLQDVIDAVGAVAKGDFLDFAGEVFDIVKKKFPAAAIIDMGIESYDLYKKARPVWKAISRMEHFGGEVIEKFISVIKSTGGNVFDKLKWKKNNYGADLLDVGDPLDFWDNLVDLFPNKVPKNGLPGEIIYEIPPTNWELKFYIDANTEGKTTISFKTNQGYQFKVRF